MTDCKENATKGCYQEQNNLYATRPVPIKNNAQRGLKGCKQNKIDTRQEPKICGGKAQIRGKVGRNYNVYGTK